MLEEQTDVVLNRAPWYFVEDEGLVRAVRHRLKAEANIELGPASYYDP
jgi:hypothetical protein